MKVETKLAHVFTEIEESGKSTDTVASGILDIVREAGIKDVESFNPLVIAAYTKNNWNPRPGRPTPEAANLEAVPPTVRTYVTGVRRAFRHGIDVARVKTFYELRKMLRRSVASKKRHDVLLRAPKEVKENLDGVALDSTNDVNGALIHDIGFVYLNLPRSQQEMFERQLQQLVHKYLPSVNKKAA